MSWTLHPRDLGDLARGAALLGTGGGGDPHVGRLLVAEAMARHGPVSVLDPCERADLPDQALVIPTAMMGAPTVIIEKVPRGDEAVAALRALEAHLGRAATATMPIECGGINSMMPLLVAARTGLPVVDADGMGRAFPELQMETFAVYGVHGSPMAITSERGESVIIDTGADDRRMEWLSRGVTIRLGGASHIAEYAMSGADVRRTAVPHTLSLALMVGRSIAQARTVHRDPLEALTAAFEPTLYSSVHELFRGKVTDVERRTQDGFTRGRAAFTDEKHRATLEIRFQNENLLATRDGQVVAMVPDLVCVLDAETTEPITTDGLRYGQRVLVVGISTPELMRTPAALATFGPRCFGLDIDFVPVETLCA